MFKSYILDAEEDGDQEAVELFDAILENNLTASCVSSAPRGILRSMSAYSKALRLKVLAAVGIAVCRARGGPRPSASRWRRSSAGSSCAARRAGWNPIPGRPSVKGKALRDWLPGQFENNPDLTLEEHCEADRLRRASGFAEDLQTDAPPWETADSAATAPKTRAAARPLV